MGDINNPRIWTGGELFVGPVGTTPPTDIATPLNAGFDSVGLLSEDGMSEGRESESKDHFAQSPTGLVLVRTTNTKHKRTIKVVMLEDNPVVNDLINPGTITSVVGDVTTRTLPSVPPSNPKCAVIVHRDGNVTRRRSIGRCEATEVSEIEMPTDDMTAYEVTFTIYDDNGDLWSDISDDPQTGPGLVLAAVAITGAPPDAVAEIAKLTATATFTPAGSVDVSTSATWTSSDEAVATVDVGGYVTGVAAGAATITATYGAESDTQAVAIA